MRSDTRAPYLTRSSRCAAAKRATIAWLGGLLAILACVSPANAATTFYIRGGGAGHGVGMSQYGARGYALHGWDDRAILAHYYQGTALGSTDPMRVVRVLLADGSASFSGASAAGLAPLDPVSDYRVTALPSGALQVVSSAGTSRGRFTSPLTVTGPGSLIVGGHAYRGSLQFRPDGHGGVETVNAVGLDDYVRGVIAEEMPASWPAQALEAQAVAARTYAIATGVGAAGYDVYDDTRSQMYGGVGAQTPATDAAVAATSGEIVTYAGAPAVTYFFASSGGYTENVENVWPGATPEPWLRGVPDPYDGAGGDPYHRWGGQMSVGAAAAGLGALVDGRLIGIRVLRQGASSRIIDASVVASRGHSTVTGTQLQSVFGLTSTDVAFTTITTDASPTGLAGSVYPVPHSATIAIQQRIGHAWRTVSSASYGRGGTYRTPLTTRGSYRVAVGALRGPPVMGG